MTRPPTVAEILELHRKNARLLAENKSLREDAGKMWRCVNYFVKRVEDGTIRSRTTYQKFKTTLSSLSNSYE